MREWISRFALLAGSLVFVAAAVEVALRIEPELFGSRTANQILSAYTTKPGGIYYFERTSEMNFMHPNDARRAYFNGYAWSHRTDERGFRNPPGRPVDGALLLGDSMIYGHGTEEEDGVASQLERRGHSVYNLSRQGDSLYQHYVLLRTFLEPFSPQQVVLFVFYNDFSDLLQYRGLDRLREMPEIHAFDYETLRGEILSRPSMPHSRLRTLRYQSRTYRLFLALRSRIQRGNWASSEAERSDDPSPFNTPLLEDEAHAVLSHYYERIVGDLADRCGAIGADLYLVYLDAFPVSSPGDVEGKRRALELLRSAARKAQVRYLETGSLLECDACALPGDGHLTAEGHRRLAEFLDRALGPT